MKKNLYVLTILFFSFGTLHSQGSDNAGNYGNAWSGNGGNGFSDWSFNTFGGGGAGSFLGQTMNSNASDANGNGDSNGDGDINTSSKAWGLFANGGGTSEAFRFFNTDMIVNDRLLLSMDIGNVDNTTTVGLQIQRDDAVNLLEIFFVGGTSNIVIIDASGNTNSVGWSDEGFNIQVDITGLSGGVYSHSTTITQIDGGASTTKSGNFINAGQVGKIRLYNANAGNGTSNNLYFNSLAHQVGALPTELKTFYSQKERNIINLIWETAFESQNSHFEIQKSLDNRYWSEIGQVKGQGTSTENQEYLFVDKNPAQGLNYYRLKQVDFDGNYEYSNVISVDYRNGQSTKIFPNPIKDELNIQFDNELESAANIQIFNAAGVVVSSENLPEFTKNYQINVNDIQPGLYWLEIRTDEGRVISTHKFVKE